MQEHEPTDKKNTSRIIGAEKSVLDQIRDDYVAGVISKEEYGNRFREEIDRRQRVMSAPRPKQSNDGNGNGSGNGNHNSA